jgi:hypothetical protein
VYGVNAEGLVRTRRERNTINFILVRNQARRYWVYYPQHETTLKDGAESICSSSFAIEGNRSRTLQGCVGEEQGTRYLECVCVFLASGYEWVTVMHEIPISSAQSMTSYFHTLGLSSTAPLVPLAGAVTHEKVPTSP